MSAPPPLPGRRTFGRRQSPMYEVLRLPKRSISAPPMKPRSTSPCWSRAMISSVPVHQSAPGMLGVSLMVSKVSGEG